MYEKPPSIRIPHWDVLRHRRAPDFFTAAQMNAHKATSDYELTPIALSGSSGVVSLDYFAYDRSTGKLWVPASNTGNVDVIDEKSDAVSQVTGFKTGEVELRGRKVPLGPTAVSVGDGVVYIGNFGDSGDCWQRRNGLPD